MLGNLGVEKQHDPPYCRAKPPCENHVHETLGPGIFRVVILVTKFIQITWMSWNSKPCMNAIWRKNSPTKICKNHPFHHLFRSFPDFLQWFSSGRLPGPMGIPWNTHLPQFPLDPKQLTSTASSNFWEIPRTSKWSIEVQVNPDAAGISVSGMCCGNKASMIPAIAVIKQKRTPVFWNMILLHPLPPRIMVEQWNHILKKGPNRSQKTIKAYWIVGWFSTGWREDKQIKTSLEWKIFSKKKVKIKMSRTQAGKLFHVKNNWTNGRIWIILYPNIQNHVLPLFAQIFVHLCALDMKTCVIMAPLRSLKYHRLTWYWRARWKYVHGRDPESTWKTLKGMAGRRAWYPR